MFIFVIVVIAALPDVGFTGLSAIGEVVLTALPVDEAVCIAAGDIGTAIISALPVEKAWGVVVADRRIGRPVLYNVVIGGTVGDSGVGAVGVTSLMNVATGLRSRVAESVGVT